MPRRRRAESAADLCTADDCNTHWEDYEEEAVVFANDRILERNPACGHLFVHLDTSGRCHHVDHNNAATRMRTAAAQIIEAERPREDCHTNAWVDSEGVCQHPQHDLEDGAALMPSEVQAEVARAIEARQRIQEVPTPDMPRPTYEAGEVQLIPCAYVERQCLRRDRDGNVPAVDENGRRLTEFCTSCSQHFCTQHRHLRQNRPENYCAGHGMFHPRCIITTECEGCNRSFCATLEHEANGDLCHDWLDQDPQDVEFDTGGYGGYQGPYREAELLFEGDTPVAGLAEGKRYIAFELEEELRPGASGQFTLPEKFGITTDGSLRDNGIEVTFPPSRQDALVENVRVAVEALQRGGYHATNRCGMHTHIDLRDKQDDAVFQSRLFATFYAVEDILFAMQGNNRVGNSYCAPLRQNWSFYDTYGKEAEHFEFVFYKQPKTVAGKLRIEDSKRHKGGNRYNAFNFLSVGYRGSLEVRLHEGCLNARQMLLWAELLQKIVQRVEDGITYPTLRKLVDMAVSPEKLALFARVFKLDDAFLRHIQERIESHNGGRIAFRMPYRVNLGTPKKGRAKSILPRRTFNATHRRCRWCGATIALDRRCSYCRREPAYERDEFGMADERVMRLRAGRNEYGDLEQTVMTEAEYNRIAGLPATRR